MGISIHPIQMGIGMVYAVREEGVILIDGGGPGKANEFRKGIEEASIRSGEIQLVVLTHGHWDHIGSVKDIKGLTGAKVLLHEGDMGLMAETHLSPPPGLTTWGKISAVLIKLYSPFIRVPTFEVDIVAGDEEISLSEYGISGKVIPTPGHSRGSVSVLLDSGDAFVGDLAMNGLPVRFGPGLPIFGDDIRVVKASWRKLLDAGAKTVYPGHGKPFPAEIMRKAVV